MRLWPHQQNGLTELTDAIAAGETRICVTSPTGGGKTRMFSEFINWCGDSVNVMTNRRMLFDQLRGNLDDFGIEHSLRASGHDPSIADVTLSMIQTEVSWCVNGLRTLTPASYVVWDECVAEGSRVRTELGWVPIESASKCKYALSIVGGTQSYCRITRHFEVGVRTVLELELERGEVLKCTPNHLIMTARGWIPAGDLEIGDNIASVDAVNGLQSPGIDLSAPINFERATSTFESLNRKGRQFWGHCSETRALATHTPNHARLESQEITRANNLSGCSTNAGFFRGWGPRGRSEKIRDTATNLPGGERPLVSSSPPSMILCGQTAGNRYLGNGSSRSGASVWLGGSAMMAAEAEKASCFTLKDFRTASRSSLKNGSNRLTGQSRFSRSGDCTSSTSQDELEMQFGPSCKPTFPTACGISWSRVARISPARPVPVHDLEIEGSHCYFANGVLVHNCHVMAGDTMMQIRGLRSSAINIGFTATPLGIDHAYDRLIVAGTNSELRACGALVPAYTFGPDEPDTKWVGKVKIDDGECGIPNAKRMQFAQRVFGRVVENYRQLNPDGLPAILFAPGVRESLWFAEKLTEHGISSAHIDGENVWLDGEQQAVTAELREEIRDRCEAGEIKVVCNRFVLREGIDWTFIEHGIFATVFGSLTSYLQAGGRLLRAHPGKSRAIVQDHGGNWWRHGSLNSDREWDLSHDDRIVSGLRAEKLRSKKEPEPIVCPSCSKVRLAGPVCECGYRHTTKTRPVLQADGTLREMRGDIYRARRLAEPTERLEKDWVSRIWAVKRSKKDSVKSMTFAQVEANFARENDWRYPPRTLPMMPVNEADWFRPVRSCEELT